MNVDPVLVALIRVRRESRDLEYKGSSGREPYVWGVDRIKARIARTAMAMANIGGGAIVIGMDQVGSDTWEANGVSLEVDRSYEQDQVQQYINGRADPYVKLAVLHLQLENQRFVVIQVEGFDELPVVCTTPASGVLRQGAIYTRSYAKNATVEIQSQSEMRELLDRAIEVGVRKRLRPFDEILARGIAMSQSDIASRLFEKQGDAL
ncbi:MAG: ATP-binding protein [Dehalococcoidia bacterium]